MGSRLVSREIEVHEILSRLPPTAWVLDLGAAGGSFAASATQAHVIRLDLEPCVANAVAGDASCMPFAAGSFDAIIANHSLEHIVRLPEALREIGRVLKPNGAIFVSVPDASTLTDRIYRWLSHGGGHVNPFTDPAALAREISAATATGFTACRTLHSGLSFLHRDNLRSRPQRKLMLFFGGSETFLRLLTLMLRWADRWFGTRLSVYGWALYFGPVEGVCTRTLGNVCVRCGSSGDPQPHELTGSFPAPRWRCADCGTENYFTKD